MHMPSYGTVPQPRQMAELVAVAPLYSRQHDEPEQVSSRETMRRLIERTWGAYRKRFRYTRDIAGDVWLPNPPDARGVVRDDCEGFVFGMAADLDAVGVPRGAMLAVTCEVAQRHMVLEGHMVLAVHNDWTTLIIDVRKRGVYRWNSRAFRGYRWHNIQHAGHETWQKVGKPPTLADAARRAT